MARLLYTLLAGLLAVASTAAAPSTGTELVVQASSRSVSSTTSSSSDRAGLATFTNRNRFLFDVDGNQVEAYGAKVYYFEDKYYLYGLNFATGDEGVLSAYSTVDLVNWKSEGAVAPASAVGGRPHVLYSASLNKYVLWSNLGAGYSVSTAATPTSGFDALVGNASLDARYDGLQPADLTVVDFGAGDAYLVWSVLDFTDPRAGSLWPAIYQTMHVSPLTGDLTNTTGESWNVSSAAFDLVDQQTESPDVFKRNGTYYVVVSNTCAFCSGTVGVVYRSASMRGPWTRQIIAAYSCGGQVEGVLPLTDPATNETSWVWHSTTTPGGPRVSFAGHIFQPLEFNADGSVRDLNCSAAAEFQVPFTRGVGEVASGVATRATDGTPAVADYEPVCDSDLYYRIYQTWTNTKNGTLESVSVNVAAGNQTSTLAISVFKFSNLEELVSPGYKWTLLGTKTFLSSDLDQSFRAATIPINGGDNATTGVHVAAGDKLGFALGEVATSAYLLGNLVPYCHLEYATTDGGDADMVMFEQGSGQNSPRGFEGEVSAVRRREGRAVRFFANVV